MTAPWWKSQPPAEMSIDCSGQAHRMRWENGSLAALDHDDPSGERALAALGGERCACVEVLDAWERHRDDLRLLVLASRGAGDPLTQMGGGIPRQSSVYAAQHAPVANRLIARRAAGTTAFGSVGWVAHAPLSPTFGPGGSLGAPDGDELPALLSLGGGLSDRLVATVLATWAEHVGTSDERVTGEGPALKAALFGRVALAVRSWLGEPGVAVHVDMIDPADPPTLTRSPEGISARLPFDWLTSIWVPGLTVVLGRFGLGLVESGDRRQRVMTVGPDLVDRRPVTINLEE